jgi:hypothetical protein
MNGNWNSSTADNLTIAQLGTGSTSISLPTGGFGFENPFQGKTNNWLTPPALLERLGTFDLDPCGCARMPWLTATTTYFLPEHDGLTEPWHGRVWCNPPYGPNVGEWAKRMAEHQNGIMLIFARTETSTWQKDIFPFADATGGWLGMGMSGTRKPGSG